MRKTLVFNQKDRQFFNDLKTGRKTIETRAGTPSYQGIKPGTVLTMKCGDEKIEMMVDDVKKYESVEELIALPDFDKILPGVTNVELAKRIYYSFPGYEERIKKHGILAFHVRPI